MKKKLGIYKIYGPRESCAVVIADSPEEAREMAGSWSGTTWDNQSYRYLGAAVATTDDPDGREVVMVWP